jgi:uncharacterized protein YigE (DUF2233 family)
MAEGPIPLHSPVSAARDRTSTKAERGFYVGGGKVGILETSRFLAEMPKANFATQSGPMLIVNRKIHPNFRLKSPFILLASSDGVKLFRQQCPPSSFRC